MRGFSRLLLAFTLGIGTGCTDLSEPENDNATRGPSSTSPPSSSRSPAVAAPAGTQHDDHSAAQREFDLQQQLQQSAKNGPRAALIARVDQLDRSKLGGAPPMVPLPLSRGAPYLFHHDGEIKALDLRWLPVTDADLLEISKLPRVETLWLDGAPITDTAVEAIGEMKTLRELKVSATKLSPEAVERLRQLLPECKVESDQSAT